MDKEQAMAMFIRNFAELIINRLPMEDLHECLHTNKILVEWAFITDTKLLDEWDEFMATYYTLRDAEWLHAKRTCWDNEIDEESTDYFDEFIEFCELDDALNAMSN